MEAFHILNKLYSNQIKYHLESVIEHASKIRHLEKEREEDLKIITDSNGNNTELHKKKCTVAIDDKCTDAIADNFSDDFSDQDMIWDRIHATQLSLNKKKDLANPEITTPIPDSSIYIKDQCQNDNSTIVNNLEFNQDLNIRNGKDVKIKPPVINALYKVNPKTRNNIIKNIFIDARNNIKKLSELNDDYKNNFDEKVTEEADRLLMVYLKTN